MPLTLGNLLEALKMTQMPAGRERLNEHKARGMIAVRAEDIDGVYRWCLGFGPMK